MFFFYILTNPNGLEFWVSLYVTITFCCLRKKNRSNKKNIYNSYNEEEEKKSQTNETETKKKTKSKKESNAPQTQSQIKFTNWIQIGYKWMSEIWISECQTHITLSIVCLHFYSIVPIGDYFRWNIFLINRAHSKPTWIFFGRCVAIVINVIS